jgi:hypothetical protein
MVVEAAWAFQYSRLGVLLERPCFRCALFLEFSISQAKFVCGGQIASDFLNTRHSTKSFIPLGLNQHEFQKLGFQNEAEISEKKSRFLEPLSLDLEVTCQGLHKWVESNNHCIMTFGLKTFKRFF